MNTGKSITVQTLIQAPIEKVRDAFTKPEHIVHWYFASDDWKAPSAKNDLRVGGVFKTRMCAKDKSAGFDFEGKYTTVVEKKTIEYVLADDRKIKVDFAKEVEVVRVTETFDMETENSEELQRAGWQAILENFKKYVESH